MQGTETALRVPQVPRGEAFEVIVNGQPVIAHPGETVAAVLLAAGVRAFNVAADGTPRGLYCGIGRCFGCLVTVDGVPAVRACVTQARPDMQILTGQTLP